MTNREAYEQMIGELLSKDFFKLLNIKPDDEYDSRIKYNKKIFNVDTMSIPFKKD